MMKRLISFILCLAFGACTSEPVPMHKMDYVGMYEYRTDQPLYNVPMEFGDYNSTNHDGDCLVLKPSGEYILLQSGTTKAITETKGQWKLTILEYYSRDYYSISLDLHGYPIRVKKGKIRLLINDDLGVWYEKVSDSVPDDEAEYCM